MKFQSCFYKARDGSKWRNGLACVADWDGDARYILDAETGERFWYPVWHYEYDNHGPCKYLELGTPPNKVTS